MGEFDGIDNPFAGEFEGVDNPFKTPANPVAANDILLNGVDSGLSPEEKAVVSKTQTPQDYDFQTATAFYNTRTGTNNPPQVIQANIEYEYGKGATAATANAANLKAAKHQESRIKGLGKRGLLGIEEAFTMAGEGIFRGVKSIADDLVIENQRELDKLILSGEDDTWRGKAFSGLVDWHTAVSQAMEEEAGFITSFREEAGEKLKSDRNGFLEQVAQGVGQLARVPLALTPLAPISLGGAMYQEGYDEATGTEEERQNKAQKYAMIATPIEYASDLLILNTGAVQGLKGLKGKELASGIVKNLKPVLAKMGMNFASEGVTEVLQDGVLNKLNGKKMFDHNSINTFLVSGTVGAIGGGGASIGQMATPFTLGDATRTRKQNTNEEIATIVEEADIPAEQKPLMEEMLTNPTEASTDAYNAFEAEEEAFVDEITERASRVLETREKASGEQEVPEIGLGEGFTIEEQEDVNAVVNEEVKPSDIVGLSRKNNDTFLEEVGAPVLEETERITQKEDLESAIEEGIVENADDITADLLANPREISSKEIMGLTARKAQISNEIEGLQQEIAEAEKAGDNETFIRASRDLRIAVNKGVAISKAVSQNGASKLGRAMSALNATIDRRSFDLVSVVSAATARKNNMLTDTERTEFEGLTKELVELEAKLKETEAKNDALMKELSEKLAKGEIEQTAKEKKTTAARKKNKKSRDTAKEKLRKLGVRVNDITGMPIEVGRLISDIAVSHIRDGAKTLDEVIQRVKKDVPEASSKNIYDALGGRVKGAGKKAIDAAAEHVSELKKQAKLMGQILDATDGILDPTRPSKPTSAEVKALKTKLKQYSASIVSTEADESRINSILDRISLIEDMVERVYRPVKVVKSKSQDLKYAEELLKTANAELSAQNRIALLEELIREGDTGRRKTAGKSVESMRLLNFRARIEFLQKQLAKTKKSDADKTRKIAAEKRVNAKIDELTKEVEKFIRTVKPVAKKNAKNQTIAELQQDKRDQDRIVDLLEAIRNRKVSEKVAKEIKADRRGYTAMIKNLREELTNTEWYQDWKQEQSEAKQLIESKETLADMDRRLKEGDFEGFITTKEQRQVKNKELIETRLEIHQKKKQINAAIDALKPRTALDIFNELYDIPRSAKLTADVGHIWRQAGFVLSNLRRMKPFKFTKDSFAVAFSQDKADALDMWVEENQYYDNALKAGVHLPSEHDKLGERERALTSNLLENIPFFGAIVKGSGRTQITMIKVLRMQLFEGYMQRNPDSTEAEQKEFAEVYNILTGYGEGKMVSSIAPVADRLLTSTRFTFSRIQAPFQLARPKVLKNKALRKQLAEDTAWFWSTRLLIMMGLTAMSDDIDWGKNPDHHTFGKLMIKLPNGNTRVYDPWAGLQRVGRLLKDLKKSEKQPLDLVLDFFSKSQNPTLSAIYGSYTGKNYFGEDIGRVEATIKAFVPISIEGFYEATQNETGAIDATVSTLLDVIGVNSYVVDTESLKEKTKFRDRDKEKKKKKRN